MSKEPIYSIKVSDMERRIIIKSLTFGDSIKIGQEK